MFSCDKCGLCCRNIGGIPLYKELDRGDGICKYLKGSLCSIYDRRPLLCRVDDSYEAFYKDLYTKDEFYKMNYNICNFLKSK